MFKLQARAASGLGLFMDNPAILESALGYLNRFELIPSHEEKTNV